MWLAFFYSLFRQATAAPPRRRQHPRRRGDGRRAKSLAGEGDQGLRRGFAGVDLAASHPRLRDFSLRWHFADKPRGVGSVVSGLRWLLKAVSFGTHRLQSFRTSDSRIKHLDGFAVPLADPDLGPFQTRT